MSMFLTQFPATNYGQFIINTQTFQLKFCLSFLVHMEVPALVHPHLNAWRKLQNLRPV